MFKKCLMVGMTLVVLGCGGIDYRRTVEYASDAAQKVCEMSVVADFEKDLGGLTPSEWCTVMKNTLPYMKALADLSSPKIPVNPYNQPDAGN
jgi:hypothetical protein